MLFVYNGLLLYTICKVKCFIFNLLLNYVFVSKLDETVNNFIMPKSEIFVLQCWINLTISTTGSLMSFQCNA